MNTHEVAGTRHGRRFPLAAQVFGAVGGVLAALGLATAVSIGTVSELQDRDAELRADQAAMTEGMADLLDTLWQARLAGFKLDAAAEAAVPDLVDRLKHRYDLVDQELASFEQLYADTFGEELPFAELASSTWGEYKAAVLSAWEPTEGVRPASEAERSGFDTTVESQFNEFDAHVDMHLEAASVEVADDAASATTLLFIVLAVGAGAGAAFAWLVGRRIRRNSAILKESMAALAAGDLTVTAQVSSRDEMGEMAELLSAAQSALRETMSGVVSSAVTVAAAAEELSAANAEVSAGSQATSARAG
ncbi:HAMP domain-containing protein, partial [Demequina gelatinilytica]|uniref:HAMP domain-containing protein n=1 Tax=Demequina gelatinilytica TaxID=1638980 RepID=UPI0012E0911B